MTNTTTIYHHEDFILNKYHNWYFKIIIKAQSEDRVKGSDVYFENHHIIPKSMGGSNSNDNLVLLTAKEHYIVHLILPKMITKGSRSYISMVYAYNMMGSSKNNKRYTSKLYQRFKNDYYENCNGNSHSEETKRKLSNARMGKNNPFYNKNHSEETKLRISVTQQGENNYRFRGYYHTPWGKFPSSLAAETTLCSDDCIRKWCENPNKIILHQSISQSLYMKSLTESPLGKTFKEIGFNFELL